MARTVIAGRAAGASLALALGAVVARAQTRVPAGPSVSTPASATVLVQAPPCIGQPYDRSALGELLRVELRALGVTTVLIESPDASPGRRETLLATVTVSPPTCDAAAQELTIRVVDFMVPKTVERRMTISDVAVAERPRALAIGIAELVSASFAEVELDGAPKAVEPPPLVRTSLETKRGAVDAEHHDTESKRLAADLEAMKRADRDAKAARDARARTPSVDIGASARSFASRGTSLFGAFLGGHIHATSAFAVELGASFGGGDTAVNAGSVSIFDLAGRVGAGFTTGGDTELEFGPALEVGYGWANGSSTSAGTRGTSYGNAVALALASATLRAHPTASWAALLGVDVGYTLRDVAFLSDTAKVAGIGGAVLGARAGVGIAF